MILYKILSWTNVPPPSKWHVEHYCTDWDVASFQGTQKTRLTWMVTPCVGDHCLYRSEQ